MPRPRTYAQSARTHPITVRVTPDVHARLTAEAAQIGTSVAGLAERYIAKGSIRIEASAAPPPLPPALLAEIKRLGNNLNQIAHTVNANLPPSAPLVIATLRDLTELIIKNELLSQRINAVNHPVKANDSAPPRSRQEFQRVMQLRPARPEGEDA